MKLLKQLKWLGLSILCLCIAFYFCLTSSFVVKLVLLPFLSYQFGFPVTAEQIKFSPFSSILRVKNVKFGYKNCPFIDSKEASWKVNNIFGLISADVNFSDMKVNGITFHAVKSVDGKWNFPWLYEGAATDISTNPSDEVPPVILTFSEINVNNGKVVLEIKRKDKSKSSKVEFYDLNVISSLFHNESKCNVKFNGKVKVFSGNNVKIKECDSYGSIETFIDKWLVPEKELKSALRMINPKGEINNLNLTDHKLDFMTDIVTEKGRLKLNKIVLKSEYKGEEISNVHLSGVIKPNYDSGQINIVAKPASPRLLNLFSNVFVDYNFGDMKLFYNGILSFDSESLKNSGKFTIDDFQITKNKTETKGEKVFFDLFSRYNAEYKFATELFYIKHFNGSIIESYLKHADNTNLKDVEEQLKFTLNDAVSFYIADSVPCFMGKKATGTVQIKDLNMHFLNPFLIDIPKTEIVSGSSNGLIKFSINQGKGNIDIAGKVKTDNYSAHLDKFSFKNIELSQKFDCSLNDYETIMLKPFFMHITKNGESVLEGGLVGNINLPTASVDLNISIPALSYTLTKYLPEEWRKNLVFQNVYNLMKPFYVNAKGNIKLDFKENTGRIGKAEIILTGKEKGKNKLSLSNYIGFKWDKDEIALDKKLSTDYEITDVNLDFFNNFITNKNKFYFTGGTFSTVFKCLFNKDLNNITLNGHTNLNSMGVKIKEEYYNDLDVYNKYLINIDFEREKVFFKEFNVQLDVKKKKALEVNAPGYYQTRNNALTLDVNVISLNRTIFNLFPLLASTNITSFDLSGSLKVYLNNKKISIDSLLKLGKVIYFSPELKNSVLLCDSGAIKMDYLQSTSDINIKRLFVNLKKDKKTVFNADANGSFPQNINTEGKFSVTSERLYVNFVDGLLTAFSEPEALNRGKETTLKKCNLYEDVTLFGHIALNNIVWDHDLIGTLNGKIMLKKNKLQIYPTVLKLNNFSPINSSMTFDLGYENIVPYAIRVNFNKLPIPVFLKILNIPERYVDGMINTFSMNMKGVNAPFSSSRYTVLKGEIDATAQDIVLPFKLTNTNYSIFRILFLPLQMFSKIMSMVPEGLTSESIYNTMDSTAHVFAKIKEIYFKKAKAKISADNNICLDDVVFYGGKNSLVKFMRFYGSVELDKSIDLRTYSNISGLHVPVEIKGTIDEPNPNMERFVYLFCKDNTLNFFNPQNIVGFFKDAQRGMKRTFQSNIDV